MDIADSTVAVGTALSLLFEKIENAVNKTYERKDLTLDNKKQLQKVKTGLEGAKGLLPQLSYAVEKDIIVATELHRFKQTLQTDYDDLNELAERIKSAKIIHRVRRMKDLLDEFEEHVNHFFKFARDNISPILHQSLSFTNYKPGSNVPPNPPRLTLDYSTTDTYEGQLKEAILKQNKQRVVGVIASGQGGVGKSCALRGLADVEDIKKRFPGGTLYIQLGNDATIADIVQGLHQIVSHTGGIQVPLGMQSLDSLSTACNMASFWFRSKKCLFLVDDIWKVNGIDLNVFIALGAILNEHSRMVYTTRDNHFLNRAHNVIQFKAKKPNGSLSRKMLLTHAGFSEQDYLSFDDKNTSAFDFVLGKCQGLPLAFGIIGGAILTETRYYEGHNRKENVWSDYEQKMERNSSISEFLKSPAGEYGWLSKVVDISLKVLDKRHERDDFSKLFRAFCVFRKQQCVPMSALQRLWSFKSLEKAESIAELFYNVSLVQISKPFDQMKVVQLHDLVLGIAIDEATKHFELQAFHESLIKNYSSFENPNLKTKEGKSSMLRGISKPLQPLQGQDTPWTKWWNVPNDGYIHENVSRLLRCSGRADRLLWLLSQPEWIVHRLINDGINPVESDLNEGLMAINNSTSNAEHKEHLLIIGKAARLSSSFITENPNEVWFQLYGRLLWHADRNKWTERFITSLEVAAEKPWAKATLHILQQANHQSHGLLRGKGKIMSTRLKDNVVWFVWGSYEHGMGITSWDMTTGQEKNVELHLRPFIENRETPHVTYGTFSADGANVIILDTDLYLGKFKTKSGQLEKLQRIGCRSEKTWECILACFEPIRRRREHVIGLLKGGEFVATTNSNNTVQLWDSENGELIGEPLRGHDNEVRCAEMNADGSLIVTGSKDTTVRLWDPRSGEPIGQPLHGHNGLVECVVVSRDGSRIVSGSTDRKVIVWDALSGTPVVPPLQGHDGCVECLEISSDGALIVSGSWDNTVRLWDAQSYEPLGPPLRGHTGWVTCVGISADGSRVVSGSNDKTVRAWDVNSNMAVGQTLRNHTRGVDGVEMNVTGSHAVSESRKKMLSSSNNPNGEAVQRSLRDQSCSLECMGMSGDGNRIVSGSWNKTVKVWDARNGEQVCPTLNGHSDSVVSVGMNTDGSRVVSGSKDKTVIIWDTRSGEQVGQPLLGHTSRVGCVGMSRDGGRVVSGSWDKTVIVWDARTGEPIVQLPREHTGPILCVGMSSDGYWLVSGSKDKTVRVWNVQNCEAEVQTLLGHTDSVLCVGISEDGSRVVSGSMDKKVMLWDLSASEPTGIPLMQSSPVLCLGFDEKISLIATICKDGTQKVWNAKSQSCILNSSGHQWNCMINRLPLTWSGNFADIRKKQIIDVNEKGTEIVVASSEVELLNVPGSDVYFSEHMNILKIMR